MARNRQSSRALSSMVIPMAGLALLAIWLLRRKAAGVVDPNGIPPLGRRLTSVPDNASSFAYSGGDVVYFDAAGNQVQG